MTKYKINLSFSILLTLASSASSPGMATTTEPSYHDRLIEQAMDLNSRGFTAAAEQLFEAATRENSLPSEKKGRPKRIPFFPTESDLPELDKNRDSLADISSKKLDMINEAMKSNKVKFPEKWYTLGMGGEETPVDYPPVQQSIHSKRPENVLVLQSYSRSDGQFHNLLNKLGNFNSPDRLIYGVVDPIYQNDIKYDRNQNERTVTKISGKRKFYYQPPDSENVFFEVDTKTPDIGQGITFTINGHTNLNVSVASTSSPTGVSPLIIKDNGNSLQFGSGEFTRDNNYYEDNTHRLLDSYPNNDSQRNYYFEHQNLLGHPEKAIVISLNDQNLLNGINLKEQAPVYTYNLYQSKEEEGLLLAIAMPQYMNIVEQNMVPRFYRIETTTGRVVEYKLKIDDPQQRSWRTDHFSLSGLEFPHKYDESALIHYITKHFMGYINRNPAPLNLTSKDKNKRDIVVSEFLPLEGEKLSLIAALLPDILGPLFLAPAITMNPELFLQELLNENSIPTTNNLHIGVPYKVADPIDTNLKQLGNNPPILNSPYNRKVTSPLFKNCMNALKGK